MYRGSTAVIKAISNGVVPLYLQRESELSIDPIFECECARTTIKNELEFFTALEGTYSERVLDCLVNFGKSFYTIFDVKTIINLLRKN